MQPPHPPPHPSPRRNAGEGNREAQRHQGRRRPGQAPGRQREEAGGQQQAEQELGPKPMQRLGEGEPSAVAVLRLPGDAPPEAEAGQEDASGPPS